MQNSNASTGWTQNDSGSEQTDHTCLFDKWKAGQLDGGQVTELLFKRFECEDGAGKIDLAGQFPEFFGGSKSIPSKYPLPTMAEAGIGMLVSQLVPHVQPFLVNGQHGAGRVQGARFVHDFLVENLDGHGSPKMSQKQHKAFLTVLNVVNRAISILKQERSVLNPKEIMLADLVGCLVGAYASAGSMSQVVPGNTLPLAEFQAAVYKLFDNYDDIDDVPLTKEHYLAISGFLEDYPATLECHKLVYDKFAEMVERIVQ